MAPTFVSGIPIYVQIADDIRAQILRGALRAGDQLTSTTEYSATYRINPATVGKAFSILVTRDSSKSGEASACSLPKARRACSWPTDVRPTWRRP